MALKNIAVGQRVTRGKLQRAKELRRSMTPAECLLWEELRGNKLGVHFRRQQVISGYIVDFYCHSAALVIELDGEIHRRNEQRERDIERDAALIRLGFRVQRFSNEDVLGRAATVIDRIVALIDAANTGQNDRVLPPL